MPGHRFAAVDGGVDDEIDQSEPPEARREDDGDRQRQNRVAEDVNGKRREPALDAFLAARDPARLQKEVGDEMLQREDGKKGAECPEGNGGAKLRQKSIPSVKLR
jgi:hypothetical protein